MGIFKGLKTKKWFQQVMAIAPTIGTALGGPFAGLALNTIAAALGVKPTEQAIEEKLANDPTALLALKDSEQEFKLEMEKLGIQEQDLHLKDVQSARAREVAVRDRTPQYLAFLSFFLFAGMAACIFFVKDLEVVVDQGQRELLFYLLATSQAALLQGLNYFLGSSGGSRAKSVAMERFITNGNS